MVTLGDIEEILPNIKLIEIKSIDSLSKKKYMISSDKENIGFYVPGLKWEFHTKNSVFSYMPDNLVLNYYNGNIVNDKGEEVLQIRKKDGQIFSYYNIENNELVYKNKDYNYSFYDADDKLILSLELEKEGSNSLPYSRVFNINLYESQISKELIALFSILIHEFLSTKYLIPTY